MDIQKDSAEKIKSCLTDKPLQSEDDDNLKAAEYANALTQFIENADTPVTIGIQGGWGSGKTSLITVLQHQLDHNPAHRTLCVLVNAWEHSLFHHNDSKAEVALSLLNGLVTGIKKSVNEVFKSKDNAWLDKTAQCVINPQNNTAEKAISLIRVGLRVVAKVGLQAASNAAGIGGDVTHAIDNVSKKVETLPPIAENVHNLRTGLKEMIGKLTYNGKPIKVVFFIDDLDRVPPPTAVEILDITKNIFDIPDCVFVLAIDYEVIVKGLEEKFGKKDPKNEREFRQYFDKIIQIPFTMPMGAYGDHLDDLLGPALEKLGYALDHSSTDTLKNLAEDAKLATGGIPRSIKRIINTLSLLQHIANAKFKKSHPTSSVPLPNDIEARFIIVSLLINFPEICKRVIERPKFPEWSVSTLNLPWKLNFEDNKKELDALEKAGATKHLFDDDWEKVVFCLCSHSDWLKAQAVNVSRLLNRLLVILGDGKNEKKLSDEGLDSLSSILESIKVVSIDSDTKPQMEFDDSSVKTDRVTSFFTQLQNILAQKLPNVVPPHTKEYAKRENDRPYVIANSNKVIWRTCFNYLYKEQPPYVRISFYSQRHGHIQRDSNSVLEEYCGKYEYWHDGKSFYLCFERPMTKDDFLDTQKLSEIADEAVKLYARTDKIQKELEKLE